MTLVTHLYVDGGVCGPNPSKKGGTYAAVAVGADCLELWRTSGVLMPADIGLPAVTNNVTELYAAIVGLEALPAGWEGTVLTDSQVTRLRLYGGRLRGVPECHQARLRALLGRLGRFRVKLLGGHPTRKELAAGCKAKSGRPVSPFNVLADRLCREAGRSRG